MRWSTHILTITVALLLGGCASRITYGDAATCGADAACTFDAGSYYAKAPDNWDGTSPLPTVLFFHGYKQSGRTVMRMKSLMQAANDAGVLVVAPNGIKGAWTVAGSPANYRDETVFADALTEEIARKWPIDRNRLYVSGFSLGGSIAWDIACQNGDKYTGFLPVSGAFWRPHPTECDAGPVTMLHVHGRGDLVVPLEGRSIRGKWRQGNVFEGFEFWRAHNACRAPEIERTGANGLICREWHDCGNGTRLALCLHDGGHSAPKGWYAEAFEWMRAADAARPKQDG